MKKYIQISLITLFLISLSLVTPAQPPFNAPNPYTQGNGGQVYGGGLHSGAIDGGLGILLFLAGGFGIKKVRIMKK